MTWFWRDAGRGKERYLGNPGLEKEEEEINNENVEILYLRVEGALHSPKMVWEKDPSLSPSNRLPSMI